jgi:hypothetical protein
MATPAATTTRLSAAITPSKSTGKRALTSASTSIGIGVTVNVGAGVV